ncbi:hypothetical protein FOYG_03937 [Fusarium oxysporum NRRL 32931]|uniref:pectin lyase n=1 Tax=Fusarium oxysporum NRRL 32931 TaxID=660029 RepID=W9J5D8_FUSOX|nr:hypothetical protein FOYG_03937 [Fusarium oxysporum NRRL 32931]
MRLIKAFVAITAFLPRSFATRPTKSERFTSSTTGGKDGEVVRPRNNQELINYLKGNTARIIYLERTFDFKGSEGNRLALSAFHQQEQLVNIKYDKAGLNSITVGSNKSIVGVGSKGVIKGKGLRLANGVSNVIIQNIHITDLNPSLVWGGEAITLNGTDNIWIDHYTTTGVFCSSGPTINTILHVVNNYFRDIFDHAYEIDDKAQVLIEGNISRTSKIPLSPAGRVFGIPTSGSTGVCKAALGRACQLNAFRSSGDLPNDDSGFRGNFKGKSIAAITSAQNAKGVMTRDDFGIA